MLFNPSRTCCLYLQIVVVVVVAIVVDKTLHDRRKIHYNEMDVSIVK